jgi:hypothetical protein
MADFFALAGENALALEWLQDAVELSFVNYPLFATHDPFLRRLLQLRVNLKHRTCDLQLSTIFRTPQHPASLPARLGFA